MSQWRNFVGSDGPAMEEYLRNALLVAPKRPIYPHLQQPLPEPTGFHDETETMPLRSAAVLLPIIRRRDEPTLLLTRRAEGLRQHGGQISFPGGASDISDTDAVATALRESREEVDLDPKLVTVLGYLEEYPTVTGYRITPVVASVSELYRPRIVSSMEVAEVFEIPLSVALLPENYREETYERSGTIVPYFAIAHEGYRIWGATAGILHNLCFRLAGCHV